MSSEGQCNIHYSNLFIKFIFDPPISSEEGIDLFDDCIFE